MRSCRKALTARSGLVVALMLACSGSGLQAGSLLEDGFKTSDYTAGSLNSQAPDLTGFSTSDAWTFPGGAPITGLLDVVADPTGLTYTDGSGNELVTTDGKALYYNDFGPHGVRREADRSTVLNGPMTSYTPEATGVYISMLLQANQAILDNVKTRQDCPYEAPRVEILQKALPISFAIQKNPSTGTPEAYALMENYYGSSGDRGALGVTKPVNVDEAVLFVAHLYTDGGDQFDLYINPTDLTDESANTAVYSGADPGKGYVANNSSYGLDTIRIQPGKVGSNGTGGRFAVDEIRIGTSWSDVVPVVPSLLVGDVNGDGVVDGLDIQPFVDLLTGGGYQAEADINADAVVDGLDIQPFVDIITGAGGTPVPEPATLMLLGFGGLAALRKRCR